MKKLFRRWFQGRQLTEQQAARLMLWRRLSEFDRKSRLDQTRLVVVDVESTGLNLLTDTLISIGAVAIVNGRIVLGDSFSVVLQQQEISRRDNILIHGISGSEQLEGVAPADALLDFLEYLGNAPLVAFHVAFDETMIRRAMREYLGLSFKHLWLDLAYLMPALNRSNAKKYRTLDDWLGAFSIQIEGRHEALADALATAQLMQIAGAQARQKDIFGFNGLQDMERANRWLNKMG